MERVVYLLGAGFSAPLGIPVMSEFRLKSQSLFFEDTEKHAEIGSVLATIEKLSVIKNFFRADLYNIEEILSVLEMKAVTKADDRQRQEFADYIRRTVEHFTPSFEPKGEFPVNSSNWHENAFQLVEDHRITPYARFIAAVFGPQFSGNQTPGSMRVRASFDPQLRENRSHRYDFISLNYDMALEKSLELLKKQFRFPRGVEFQRDVQKEDNDWPWLVKLHGSVDSGEIIPPTWNKTLHPLAQSLWSKAHDLLEHANHIRILGYSLPESDAYVRYLFKAGLMDSKNLQSIHVVCMDDNQGTIRRRYGEFFDFKYYEFFSEDLLNAIASHTRILQQHGNSFDREFQIELETAYMNWVEQTRATV